MLFFTTMLGWGLSLISGACTLAIMVLPVVMRTTEEALLAVPESYKQGGFALGAGHVRTIFRCHLHSSLKSLCREVRSHVQNHNEDQEHPDE